MANLFKPATRTKSKARIALDGPSGSGKTFTALRFAHALQQKTGGSIAVISTEFGDAEKYLGISPDGIPWNFDIVSPTDFAPTTYTSLIMNAGQSGYPILIIDSLTHAWSGEGGALELKDKKGGNSYTAWKDITPMHNRMIEAIKRSPCHIIATMRSKTEYVLELDANGKQVPRKVGMAPIQRAGMEYEFDIYGCMDLSHTITVSKSRCSAIDGVVIVKPGMEFMEPVITWLYEGDDPPVGYYAVTENDLLASERLRLDAEKLAQADRKAAEDEKRKAAQRKIAEEAKAKIKAEQNATVVKQAAMETAAKMPEIQNKGKELLAKCEQDHKEADAKPTHPVDGRVDLFLSLHKESGVSKESLKIVIGTFGCDKFSALSDAEKDAVVAWLEDVIACNEMIEMLGLDETKVKQLTEKAGAEKIENMSMKIVKDFRAFLVKTLKERGVQPDNGGSDKAPF